jgi:hypothetical protein
MPFTDSKRGVIQDVLADDNEPADYPKQIADIVNAIEPHLVIKAATVPIADATLAPFIEGMLLITTNAPKEIYRRDVTLSTWIKIFPTSYNGPATPANTLGANNDVYFQYV